MVNEFLKVFSQRERLGFPAALQQAYSELVADLRERVAYLDDEPYSLDDDSAASVASQFYRLFPSHCLKCLDSLVREESEALQRGGTGLILGWPTVTLLDIGCGTGAATAALLTLIQAYQEFLRRDGRPLRRVSVQAVGLDPSESMLELYTALLENYSYLLADWLIDVNVHAVAERFPDGLSEISRVLKPGNAHLGLAAMSNIVRVMQRSFDAGSTVWFERVRRAVAGEPVGEPRFGEAEGNALKGVLENWGLDKIALLGIATTGEHEATHSAWHRILEEMDNGIADTMLPHRVDRRGVKEVRAVFENPLDSWWRASKGRATYEERYYRDFMLITHEGYDADEQWRSVISAKNLELAWARARRHALHEDLADEIEVLLFDRSVHKKLDRLRRHLLLGDWSALQLGHMQLYEAPKKRGETRPRALVRLEEQIVAAAVVQSVGSSADAHRGASYSYRLNDEPDEFLYQYWLGLWKSFLAHSHKRAHAGTVLRSDVSHFYERVQQALLVDVVRRVLRAGARLDELASALLLRDCGPPHSCGRGLPQGHVASGFWADLYLGEADRAFRGLKGVTFARYADDMVFVVDGYESDVARTERELRTALDQLYLEPSDDKTYPLSGGQYISETSLDECLREYDERRFKPLVTQVYRLSGSYSRVYSLDPWGFVAHYSELLRLIPVSVSKPWLRRKIEQYRGWRGILVRRRLRFPPFPDSPERDTMWLDQFIAANATWKAALDALCQDMVALCNESIDQLAAGTAAGNERTKAARRVRFAAYRLCVLGVGAVADRLCEQVVRRPCTVPVYAVSRALADCGRADLLMQILDNSGSEYVRACAVRALADIRPLPPDSAISRMWEILTSPSAGSIERLKASEGLLLADSWGAADIGTWARLVEQADDPYLLKNYVLIGGRAFRDSALNHLSRLCETHDHPVVLDAVDYVMTSRGKSLTSEHEPGILLPYYSKQYPVAESDTKEVESP